MAGQPLCLPPRHLCHETCQAGVVMPSSPIFCFRPSHFWTIWTLLAATVDFVRGISAIRRIAHGTNLLASSYHSRHQTHQWLSVVEPSQDGTVCRHWTRQWSCGETNRGKWSGRVTLVTSMSHVACMLAAMTRQ